MGRPSQAENAKAENRMKAMADFTGKLWVSLLSLFQKLAQTWVQEKRKPSSTTRGSTQEEVNGLILSFLSLARSMVAD